ncbi:SEC-C domain-containing protein [Litorimonas haliclonae]|uniref:SEC-C domain-containing protein n=1 Tax=Litorimonas haliclonae TaxID=2081977 RepID=UPI0039EFE691
MTEQQTDWLLFQQNLGPNWINEDIEYWRSAEDQAEVFRLNFIEERKEKEANAAWYVTKLCKARRLFLKCWQNIGAGEYKQSWDDFETIEHICLSLLKNDFYPQIKKGVEQFLRQVHVWQKLYPYKVFTSPEFHIKKRECTICKSVRSPWTDCGHKTGHVYMGEMCSDLVTDVAIVGLSLVTDPVQKYSVMEPYSHTLSNSDQEKRFKAVNFTYNLLPSPFTPFDIKETTKLTPHSDFPNIAEIDVCPCESGRAYGKCCQNNDGVRQPHLIVLPAAIKT